MRSESTHACSLPEKIRQPFNVQLDIECPLCYPTDMNSALEVVKRWMAMDEALGNILEGLHIRSFARRWKVSEKTIRRDLTALCELGLRMEHEIGPDGKSHVWVYAPGTEYLFVRNLSGTLRAALLSRATVSQGPRPRSQAD
jgi:hypothetical protein